MPFLLDTRVALTEVTLLKYFAVLEQNNGHKPSENFRVPALLIKQKENLAQELDDENSALLNFYEKVINLINKSLTIKHHFFLEKPPTAEDELILKEAFDEIIEAYIILRELESQELMTHFLDQSKKVIPGRSCLYFLILTNIIHHNRWKIYDILREWIEALKITSQDANEIELLDFFNFLLFKDSIAEICGSNPYVNFYIEVTNPFELYHCYTKTQAREKSLALMNGFSGKKRTSHHFLRNYLERR